MLSTGILICCTVPSEAVPFVYLAFVCRSLQCLISALTQVGGGGLLFRFTSSVALLGSEGRCRQISLCGEHSQCSSHTGFAPLTGVCAFPVYTAQAPGCSIWSGPCVARGSSFRVLHKSTDSAAPAFCAFPARVAQAARSLMGALSCFCAFPARAAQAARSLMGALSRGAARLLPSVAPASVSARAGGVRAPCVCSGEMVSSCGPPPPCPRRMSTIQNLRKSLVRNWRPVCSLVGDAVFGAEFALFPSPLPLAGLGWSTAG